MEKNERIVMNCTLYGESIIHKQNRRSNEEKYVVVVFVFILFNMFPH